MNKLEREEVKGLLLKDDGYQIINGVYSAGELEALLKLLESSQINNQFGVREFLMDHSAFVERLFTRKLVTIIKQALPDCNKLIKSIYFDKPPTANWIVNWHQDLTINLENKIDTAGYLNWRVNDERVVVQPTREVLDNILTIRIHLDDCTKENGALRVIKGSHKNGVINVQEWMKDKKGREQICEVRKGGVLLMRPLLLHSSKRTENNRNRRVIHLELTNADLPNGLVWKELLELKEHLAL